MRGVDCLVMVGVLMAGGSVGASAEELKGAARRAYETATREGVVSTACRAGSAGFVFWAGTAPSSVEARGKTEAVRFEQHKVGDFVRTAYRCQTGAGALTIRTKLTHSISNSQCGAGNDFIATFAVAHVGSFSDDFLVDGCGGTTGLLIEGTHVLFCRMADDDTSGVGHCAEAADAAGARQLR